MKTTKLALFLAMLILTGCSARELEFERTYPDTTRLDEYRAQIEKIYAISSIDITTKVIEEWIQPRDFIFTGQTIEESVYVGASQYCWGKSFRDCEKMKAIHPSKNSDSTILNITVKPNGFIKIAPDSNNSVLPYPQVLEVYVYEDHKIKMYQKLLNKGTSLFEFTAPAETKNHLFMIKAYYAGKLHGISYYPINIDVQ